MSEIYFQISLPAYLSQWLVYNQGGQYPIKLKKGSIESKVIESFVAVRPKDVKPDLEDENSTKIIVPYFKSKDPFYYNYMSPKAKEILVSVIRNRFDIELFSDIYSFNNYNMRCDKLIEAWMQSHCIEIDDTNWNAILKRYQRLRDVYKAKLRRDRKREENQKK